MIKVHGLCISDEGGYNFMEFCNFFAACRSAKENRNICQISIDLKSRYILLRRGRFLDKPWVVSVIKKENLPDYGRGRKS